MEISLVMMRQFDQMLGKSRNVYHCAPFIHDFPAVSILIQLGKEARKNHGVMNYLMHTNCTKKHYYKYLRSPRLAVQFPDAQAMMPFYSPVSLHENWKRNFSNQNLKR